MKRQKFLAVLEQDGTEWLKTLHAISTKSEYESTYTNPERPGSAMPVSIGACYLRNTERWMLAWICQDPHSSKHRGYGEVSCHWFLHSQYDGKQGHCRSNRPKQASGSATYSSGPHEVTDVLLCKINICRSIYRTRILVPGASWFSEPQRTIRLPGLESQHGVLRLDNGRGDGW